MKRHYVKGNHFSKSDRSAPKLQQPVQSPKPEYDERPTKVNEKSEPSFRIPLIPTVIFLTLLTVVLIGVVAIRTANKHQSPIPTKIVNELPFPLYYPYKLPPSYSVDASSITVKNNNVLIFTIDVSNGNSIAVSEEALPSVDAS